jgi:hypothetical protein
MMRSSTTTSTTTEISMKKVLVLLASLVMTSTVFAQKILPEERATEAQILQYVTGVKSFDFGSVSAKVITTSSFAEPDQVAYLVLAKMYDYNPEEKVSAIYNLDAVLGTEAMIQKIEKGNSSIVITTTDIEGKHAKKVVLQIRGLNVSL